MGYLLRMLAIKDNSLYQQNLLYTSCLQTLSYTDYTVTITLRLHTCIYASIQMKKIIKFKSMPNFTKDWQSMLNVDILLIVSSLYNSYSG